MPRSPERPTPARFTAQPEAAEPTLDRDALEALAWIEKGMPDSNVGYGLDAPKLTSEQLKEFKLASYVSGPEAKRQLHRARKAAE